MRNDAQIVTRLPCFLKDKISREAKNERVSPATIVRKIIEQYYEKEYIPEVDNSSPFYPRK